MSLRKNTATIGFDKFDAENIPDFETALNDALGVLEEKGMEGTGAAALDHPEQVAVLVLISRILHKRQNQVGFDLRHQLPDQLVVALEVVGQALDQVPSGVVVINCKKGNLSCLSPITLKVFTF